MRRVGILGGGQLGLLLMESIYRLGGSAVVYDPDPDAPACRLAPHAFNNEWTDLDALQKFFNSCDVVTYEFENVESSSLFAFEKDKPIIPSTSVLKTTQDRILEKTFISQAQLPHVDFAVINKQSELEKTARSFGFPFILKTARGGYDGKGQQLVTNEDDLRECVAQFGKSEKTPLRAVLERALEIEMEVSCIVARSAGGEEVCFPVLENEHKNHILDTTVVPARISASLETAIKDIALAAARQLGAYGLLTTEFFLANNPGSNTKGVPVGSWHIYINEFAPRPHNSGHVTMKACTVSQFEALARILLNVPLSQPHIVAPGYYCMGNLLGDVWLAQGCAGDLNLSVMSQFPDVIDVVLYGKKEPRSKRKMGHFITYANSAQAATSTAGRFREALCHVNVPSGSA